MPEVGSEKWIEREWAKQSDRRRHPERKPSPVVGHRGGRRKENDQGTKPFGNSGGKRQPSQ